MPKSKKVVVIAKPTALIMLALILAFGVTGCGLIIYSDDIPILIWAGSAYGILALTLVLEAKRGLLKRITRNIYNDDDLVNLNDITDPEIKAMLKALKEYRKK